MIAPVKRIGRAILRSWQPDPEPAPGAIPKTEIARYLPRDPVVVDAGAHLGFDTLQMARMWPRGVVHAFEPVPAVFERLRAATAGQANVRVYPVALADREGLLPMHVSGGTSTGSSSLLEPKEHLTEHPGVTFDAAVRVPATTLDEWAEAEEIDRVDLLWLDMQGAELAAMKAGQRVLASVRAIHAEVLCMESYEGAPLYDEVREWLEGRGFRVAVEAIAWREGGNVLFVR